MIFALMLNPSIDVIYETDQVLLGETVTGLSSSSVPSGKALNAAKVVSSLGEEVGLIGLVSKTQHATFEHAAAAFDIRTHFIDTLSDVRINTTLLETATGRVTHFNAMSSPMEKEMEDEILLTVESFAAPKDVWALLGSVPLGMSPSIYGELITILKETGCHVILDTSGDALIHGIEAAPHVVKPNLEEAAQIVGGPCKDQSALDLCADSLLEKGVENVMITLGENGAFAARRGARFHIHIPKISVVDTVGCGDAAVAGMAVGLYTGLDFRERCRLSVAASMSAALHKGPGIIDRDEVHTLFERITTT
jgi:tagatose 6-phosphate kinase